MGRFYWKHNPDEVLIGYQAQDREFFDSEIPGMQIYCEAGDWLIVDPQGQVWSHPTLEHMLEAVFPADADTYEELERIQPFSTYCRFRSKDTGELVLARRCTKGFTFQGEQTPLGYFLVLLDEYSFQFVSAAAFAVSFEATDARSEWELAVPHNPAEWFPIDLEILKEEAELEERLMGMIDNPREIKFRLPCACTTHEMSVYSDEDYHGQTEFSYWQQGRGEQPWTWKTRMKMIWDILIDGNPYSDMVILSLEDTKKLRDNLNEIIQMHEDIKAKQESGKQ